MRFLLVDRVAAVEPGRSIRGWKNAAMAEDYFEWHFPGRPIVPGILILEALSLRAVDSVRVASHFPGRPIVPGMLVLEACAQLAGWLEAVSSDFERWFLLDAVRSARYYAFAVPGDRIDLALECVESDGERRVYEAESSVGDTRGCRIEFEGRVVPLETLQARAAARNAWAVLRGESA